MFTKEDLRVRDGETVGDSARRLGWRMDQGETWEAFLARLEKEGRISRSDAADDEPDAGKALRASDARKLDAWRGKRDAKAGAEGGDDEGGDDDDDDREGDEDDAARAHAMMVAKKVGAWKEPRKDRARRDAPSTAVPAAAGSLGEPDAAASRRDMIARKTGGR
ncbi:MAG TPA: hypothetical protein VGG39_24940 [Polyangiaceae bacterium]